MDISDSWFEEWFNSPYYHLLYDNRDEDEAKIFIKNLITKLNPLPTAKFLDLACGSGRHTREIAAMGYSATGIDLSPNSIEYATKMGCEKQHFLVGDMRETHFENEFDFVLNLFTSFGYFKSRDEQKQTLLAIKNQLKRNGILVLDYLNICKVLDEISESGEQQISKGKILFKTHKIIDKPFIIKKITIEENDIKRTFFERVFMLTKDDLSNILKETGFGIKTIYGDYGLTNFDKKNSDRLIIVAQKTT
ncbi:MAG: class I SAM-dependent methyltransferase [Flavobacteriales bacterium]|nr:class I SAM-dependent methyltransferase [Flavobacteriales bacterium]